VGGFYWVGAVCAVAQPHSGGSTAHGVAVSSHQPVRSQASLSSSPFSPFHPSHRRRELAKTKDAAWRLESAQRHAEVAALRGQLQSLAAAAARATAAASINTAATATAAAAAAAAPQEPPSGAAHPDPLDWAALDRVLERAARPDARGEVPSAFTCPLTMEVYRDPVVSRSGNTYERGALAEHLKKVGGWDPISRVAMTAEDVVPNHALRNAVQLYLEEHGWAWHECY